MLLGFDLFRVLGEAGWTCIEVYPQAAVHAIGSGLIHKTKKGGVLDQIAAVARHTSWPSPPYLEELGSVAFGSLDDCLDAYTSAWVAALPDDRTEVLGHFPDEAIWRPRPTTGHSQQRGVSDGNLTSSDGQSRELYARDLLRGSRAVAFRDAEGFHQLIFAIERVGALLRGETASLSGYKHLLKTLSEQSCLATEIPNRWQEWHASFDSLYELVRQGRNDALHQGAYARQVTLHAVQLSLILEDALMPQAEMVRDFMVRDVVRAAPHQPMSSVRQVMLTNSFSFLPLYADWMTPPRWLILSDLEVARFLRVPKERNKRLAITVGDAIELNLIQGVAANHCRPTDPISEVLSRGDRGLLLVLEPSNPSHLLGLLTPFDVL
jgi:hypothetical protein